MAQTTPEQFQLFKDEALKWIDRFGLKGWDVTFTNKSCRESDRANIAYRVLQRMATINLEPDWGEHEATDHLVAKAAFHEVGELFIGRLAILAQSRTTREDEIDEEVHNIIRTLENVLWEPPEITFEEYARKYNGMKPLVMKMPGNGEGDQPTQVDIDMARCMQDAERYDKEYREAQKEPA